MRLNYPLFLILLGGSHALFAQATLKDAYEGIFRIGVALNEAQFSGRDAGGAALAAAQFNTISPENVLKWEVVHPKPGVFNFEPGDKYVAYGEKNGMQIIGHCLVWHNQVPKWVFEDESGKPLSREALLDRMKDHIQHVVGRYKGRIQGWDVVNEAVNEDGTMRKSPWLTIIGEDYIAKAFEYAHEADPAAKLHYNDYNMATDPKRAGVIALIRKLKERGVPVDVAGMQGHLKLDRPTVEKYDQAISELAATGVKIAITELDIDVLPAATRAMNAEVTRREAAQAGLNPYANGLPKEVQARLAKRYADLFMVFMKHKDVIQRVTFWGLANSDSWLNNWPIRGRTSYPLLFDSERKTTPAFDAVVSVAKSAR